MLLPPINACVHKLVNEHCIRTQILVRGKKKRKERDKEKHEDGGQEES